MRPLRIPAFPPLASISKYVDVMDYIRRLVGIDYVGIGS